MPRATALIRTWVRRTPLPGAGRTLLVQRFPTADRAQYERIVPAFVFDPLVDRKARPLEEVVHGRSIVLAADLRADRFALMDTFLNFLSLYCPY